MIGLNEGERLERCLAAIQALNFPKEKTELIYVDSGSTDGSADKAQAFGARVIALKTDRPTAALARNAGWRASSAPFVLFVDGDTIIHADFASKALQEFNNPKVAVVFGSLRELYPTASIYHRILDLQWWNPPPGPTVHCCGNALVRRSALRQVQGYDSRLAQAEEPEMCFRMQQLGYVILRLDAPMGLHDLAMTKWRQYWRRCRGRGYHRAKVASRIRPPDHPIHAELRRSRVLAPLMTVGPVASLWAAVVLESPLPVAGMLGAFLFLVVGAAWQFRGRTSDQLTLFLFAIHSYVTMLPIFEGQVLYYYDTISKSERNPRSYK